MYKKPLFWYRPCSDGAYEGPIHDSSIEEVRKKSGAWKPLFDHSGDATDMAAEIERLRPLADEVQAARHVMREHNRLLVELSASQAREQQLREALLTIRQYWNDDEQESHDRCNRAMEALATPQDTSALEALIAKAGEVMRERCADFVQFQWDEAGAAYEIRALPGVTLEDLQK